VEPEKSIIEAIYLSILKERAKPACLQN